MIVKNEERHLTKCLLSAKEIVDEIIIVDTGSTDRTKEIAKAFGARVFDFVWENDFSAARNFSTAQATGKWIFILDADEVISHKDYETFNELIIEDSSKPVAYSIITRNYTLRTNTVGWHANDGYYAKEEAGTGWFPSEKVRLFQKSDQILFQYAVHERVDPSIKAAGFRILKCNIPVHHYGQLLEKKKAEKSEAYYQMGLKKVNETKNNLHAVRELAVQAGTLEKWDESIELWKRLISIKPDFPEAFINMGTAHWHLGRYNDALECAKKAIETAPHTREAYFNYAISELLLGNAKRAIPVLEGLIERSPEYMPAQFMLSAAYCCDKKKEKGLAGLKKLEQTPVGPGLSFALNDLGKRLFSAQEVEYAESLIALAPGKNNAFKDSLASPTSVT